MKRKVAVAGLVGLGLALVMAVPAAAQGRQNNIMASASFMKAAQVLSTGDAPSLKLDSAPAMFAAPKKSTAPEGHILGIGVRLGGSSFGGFGLNIRYWLSEVLGIEAGLSHYGYAFYGYTQVSGGVLYIFKKAEVGPLDLNIYAGGGVDIAFFSGSGLDSDTGIGGHGLAGVEFVLKSNPKISFGGDLGFYQIPDFFGFSSAGIASSLYFHYYIK